MNNKKAQEDILIVLLVIIFFIGVGIGVYYLGNLFMNDGFSIDYPYTLEKQKVGDWNKLWLKDDHTTVYCFDDERFIPIIEQAKRDNAKVKVYYQEYWFRGFFCSSGRDNIGTSIVTNIEIYRE